MQIQVIINPRENASRGVFDHCQEEYRGFRSLQDSAFTSEWSDKW